MAKRLFAGAARTIINPPLGIRTMGFSSRVGFVEGYESDLTATSVVLSNGASKMVVVALDLCIMPHGTALALRRRIGQAVGTPASNVLINVSHTHSAPSFPGWLPEPPEQQALQEQYQEFMLGQVVESARRANDALQPARIAFGTGESRIGVYRRERRADGFVFLGEVPDAPIDPTVGVIRVDDLRGQPIAILCSYSCHTVVVGPLDLRSSPDFPGATRDVVEQTLGGLALFLQGCGGDVMPVGGLLTLTDCADEKDRVGTILGGEVIKVAAGLRTHVRRGERTSLGSVSTISVWPWVPVEDDDRPATLEARSETIALDFIALPSLAEAEEIRAEQHRWLERARAEGDARQIAVATRFGDWGDKLVDAVRTGRTTLDFEVQALRIEDLALVALSAESFTGTALTIKARSPFPQTLVLGYSNGVCCYLPREQDFPPGGWDIRARYGVPDLLFQSYSLPTAIQPTSEERVVEAALRLVTQLA